MGDLVDSLIGSDTRASRRTVDEFERLAAGIRRARERRSGVGGEHRAVVREEDGRVVVEGDIPRNLDVEPGQVFLFMSFDQSAMTHGLHSYPAKFFPELPRWLIRRYSRRTTRVIDPFAGSGTTNVEALVAGRRSMAVDVDPFSRFLTRVKTTPLARGMATRAALVLLDRVRRLEAGLRRPPRLPQFPYRDGWFVRHALEELVSIRREIDELPRRLEGSDEQVAKVRDVMRVAFSSIVRATSNADDHCTRTVVRTRLGKSIPAGFAFEKFRRVVVSASLGVEAFSASCPEGGEVEIPGNGDARDIPARAARFGLAVTSPPYCNAVDYPRTHQLEMYLLGLASGSLAPLKKRHVGTEVVSARDYTRIHETGIAEADRVIEAIFESDPRRAYILYRYLMDMERNLGEVMRVLRPGGRYCVAVGDNLIRGVRVENWRYIASMARRVGFELETWFGSEIIRHFIKVPRRERIEVDWVIVLRKPLRRVASGRSST